MEVAESFAFGFHIIFDSIGLLGNGLLVYLAIFKSPSSLKIYSVLLINFGITDFCSSLLAIFVEQRVVPIGLSLAFISNGPCKYFGSTVCYLSLTTMSHFYSHSMWSLFLSFLYRYYVLRVRTPRKMLLVFALAVVYIPSLIQLITFSYASDPPNEIQKIVEENFPEYNITSGVFSGTVSILKWTAMFTIIHMTVPLTIMYLIIIFVRRAIIQVLEGTVMSNSTRTMHKQLLRALTFQALLPVIYFFAVLTYLLEQFGFYHSPFLEFATFTVVALHPCISPFATIYFVKPYNMWIQRKCKKIQIVDIMTISNASINGSNRF